jgi:hypothetical protein
MQKKEIAPMKWRKLHVKTLSTKRDHEKRGGEEKVHELERRGRQTTYIWGRRQLMKEIITVLQFSHFFGLPTFLA